MRQFITANIPSDVQTIKWLIDNNSTIIEAHYPLTKILDSETGPEELLDWVHHLKSADVLVIQDTEESLKTKQGPPIKYSLSMPTPSEITLLNLNHITSSVSGLNNVTEYLSKYLNKLKHKRNE